MLLFCWLFLTSIPEEWVILCVLAVHALCIINFIIAIIFTNLFFIIFVPQRIPINIICLWLVWLLAWLGGRQPLTLSFSVSPESASVLTLVVWEFSMVGAPSAPFLFVLARFSNSNIVLVHRELLKDSQIFQERSLGSGSLDCNNKEAPGLLRPLEILFSCTSILQTGFFWTICSAFSAYSICSCMGSNGTYEVLLKLTVDDFSVASGLAQHLNLIFNMPTIL